MKWLSGILEVSIGTISGRRIDLEGTWKVIVLLAWLALAAALIWIICRYVGPAFSKISDHDLLQMVVLLLFMIFLKL